MRTIALTGGFTGVIIATLDDTTAGLADATIKLALVPEGSETWPPVGDPMWITPTGPLFADEAKLAILVNEAHPLGHFWLAMDVLDNGRHELVWVMDDDDPTARELYYLI